MELLIDTEMPELSSFPSDTFTLNLVTFYKIILGSKSLHSAGQYLGQSQILLVGFYRIIKNWNKCLRHRERNFKTVQGSSLKIMIQFA